MIDNTKASKMFRAAVASAIERMGSDPATMAAVDLLADGFSNGIQGMLDYLWQYPDNVQWGSLIGAEYSTKKQSAIELVTGKPWAYWLSLPNRSGERFPAAA